MKTKSRPQYYRIRRVLEMVREGTQSGCLANSSNVKEELGVSRRTVARDMDFHVIRQTEAVTAEQKCLFNSTDISAEFT